MLYEKMDWIALFLLTAIITVKSEQDNDRCGIQCIGTAYQCVDGNCECADGFIPYNKLTRCVKCPDLGESCFGTCCNTHSNATLQCWHGVCQQCINFDGKWICKDTVDQIVLVSSTQVIMATALILGILATFMLVVKLCTTRNLRPLGNAPNYERRLSVGSLQMYVDERLRDAPPRYSNAPSNPVIVNAVTLSTDRFAQERLAPPPPYADVVKNDSSTIQSATSIHI